jgi:hypothetical protein
MMYWLVAWLGFSAVHAYIPEWSLIASRAADQHGKGSYQVEQEVSLHRETETYTVKESWIALGENNLRMTFEGRGPLKGLVQGTLLYEGTNRTFIDGTIPRSQRLGEEWLEPLFYFRSGRYLRSRLVTLKVAPPESLRERAPLNATGIPVYEAPGFIRLSRAGGSIAWAIGISPTVGSAPTLWIEQDQFVIRKYKSANQVVVHADNYAKFEDGFWYPRSRTYEFAGFKILIQTLSVKSLGKLNPADPRLKSTNLVAAKDAVHWPEPEGLREFYLRFR